MTNNGASQTCIVDPFTATCSVPDDNDRFAEYVEIDSDCGLESCGPPGCEKNDDVFVGGSTRIEGAQLCSSEELDRFSTNLISCDNKSFVVEATLSPREACDPALFTFDLAVQGFDCENPEDRVRCEVLPDGSRRITAIVAASRDIPSANIRVGKGEDANVQFEYDLDIVVRE